MTKINVTQQLIDATTGVPTQFPSAICEGCENCEGCGSITEGQPFTLRLACTRALMMHLPQPKEGEGPTKIPGEESVRRTQLALKIYNEDEPGLSTGDIEFIKKIVEEFYLGPGTVGQIWLMLDPLDE